MLKDKYTNENNRYSEVWTFGKMPNADEVSYLSDMKRAMIGSVKIKDIRSNASIHQNGDRYILVKDNMPIGDIKLSRKTIANTNYFHVDGLYVISEYRNTTAAGWFLYAIKELLSYPVIADGAVFDDAYKMFNKHHIFRTRVLDKTTGNITPLDGKINDNDKCYVFDHTDLGFKYMVSESTSVWLPLLDDF
jgi:hypothetical protein